MAAAARSRPDRADDIPQFAVKQYLGPNHRGRHGGGDPLALDIRAETVLSQAVADKTAKAGLAAAMTHWVPLTIGVG